MIESVFHWLLAMFIFTPVQAQIEERMRTAQVSSAVVEQVRTCVTGASPALVDRAANDWVWGAKTVVGVAIGTTDPLDVLSAQTPACKDAVAAVRRGRSA